MEAQRFSNEVDMTVEAQRISNEADMTVEAQRFSNEAGHSSLRRARESEDCLHST